MKKIITNGTLYILCKGYIGLLKRAKTSVFGAGIKQS